MGATSLETEVNVSPGSFDNVTTLYTAPAPEPDPAPASEPALEPEPEPAPKPALEPEHLPASALPSVSAPVNLGGSQRRKNKRRKTRRKKIINL